MLLAGIIEVVAAPMRTGEHHRGITVDRFAKRTASAIVLSLALMIAIPAMGQELSAAERQAAAEGAYDRGTRAFTAGDYARAAGWYETANSLAPAANAILQAVRAHERAGNEARAATLSLHARELYGDERLREHTQILERAAPRLLRVDVACDGCTLQVDGDPEVLRALYLAPDREHAFVAHFETGDVEQRVMGAPGESREVRFDAPVAQGTPIEGPDPVETADPTPAPPQPQEERDEASGLPVWVAIVGAGLTAVSLGLTLWSGFDTLSAADDYNAMPTRPALEDGRDLELRTNVFIGTTIGLGVATGVLAVFFTDWGHDDQAPVALAPIDGGLMAFAQGGFL